MLYHLDIISKLIYFFHVKLMVTEALYQDELGKIKSKYKSLQRSIKGILMLTHFISKNRTEKYHKRNIMASKVLLNKGIKSSVE